MTAHAEAAQLRGALKLSRKESYALRKRILSEGRTIAAYLAGDSIVAPMGDDNPNPVAMMEVAGQLVSLAGSKEKAAKAISMFVELSAK